MNYVDFPDAEYEFVGMGNRHIPTKCIALGTWDNPGNSVTWILLASVLATLTCRLQIM